ncbi:MAG: hypothetical protein KME27_10870 [Lyngbya sp. HA4199-MV5]|jgi:protein-tyrosine phosphatase|nr:hypothetical protein [Lyngbya sp. HA4199-MV5]
MSINERLPIPSAERICQATLAPERVATLVSCAVKLIDVLDLYIEDPNPIGLQLLRELADDLETAIAQAVLTAQ